MLSWFLVVAAAATAPAAAACNGDAPGPMTDLVEDGVDFDVTVDADDSARVRVHLRLRNTGAGPGLARVWLSVAGPLPPLVAHSARIRGQPATTLVDDVFAAESDFMAFANALEHGVAPEDARAGRERVALLVEHTDGGFNVRVASACSARVIDVDIDAVVAATHSHGMTRFTLPLSEHRTQIKVASARPTFIGGQRKLSRVYVRDDDDSDGIDDDTLVDIEVDGADVFGPQLASSLTTTARRPLPQPPEPAQGVGEPVGADVPPSTTRAPAHPSDADADADARAPFTVAHAALHLPAPLSATPPELRVVFVVDASVSAADGGLDRGLALARDIVHALPNDAGYAVVAAGRTPRLVVPPWQPAGRWRMPTLDVENGSELPAAVALAHKMARDALPGSGRVIVLSDLQLAFDHEHSHALARQVRGGPLVHVLALSADVGEQPNGDHGPLSWSRVYGDDGDAYAASDVAAAAEDSGGMLLDVDDGEDDRAALALSLVRPTSFDRPTLVFGDASDQSLNVVWHADEETLWGQWPAVLHEGEGVAASMFIDGPATGHVEGFVWGQKVVLPLARAADATTRVALLGRALNTDLSLDDDVVRAVAVADRFVSPATSLLFVPAFRPAATDEVGSASFYCGCGGSCGGSCSGGTSCGIRNGKATVLAEPAILQALGARIAERCGVDVDADIEVSDLEILQVSVRRGGACVREALWATRLDKLTPGDGSFEAHRGRTVIGTPPSPDDVDVDADADNNVDAATPAP
jgi:hypothetical protein